MRINLVISDAEYMEALLTAISRSDRRIYAEVGVNGDDANSLVLTDNPEIPMGGERDRDHYVYISENREDKHLELPGPFVLFKYEHISVMLQELVLCNYLVNGAGLSELCNGTTIGICSRDNSSSEDFAREFAKELAYRTDSRILLMSLKYLNPYGNDSMDIRRVHIMYSNFRRRRSLDIDTFFFRNEYDVYHIAQGRGWNNLTDMNYRDIEGLILTMGELFDYIIVDIGESYSRVNAEVLASARHVIYAGEHAVRSDYDSIMNIAYGDIEEGDITVADTSIGVTKAAGEVVRVLLNTRAEY